MGALPPAQRISREDLKGAPSWIDPMIRILNDFMQTVYAALNRNLTFGENVIGEFKSFQVKAGAAAGNNTFTFITRVPQPQGVFIIAASVVAPTYTPLTSAVWCSWRLGSGQIIIDSITGLTNGSTYNLRVLVI